MKGAKVSSLTKDKAAIDLTIENKKACQIEKNYMFFNIPEAINGVGAWGLNTLTEKRNTPIELSSDMDETYSYTIQLPSDIKLLSDKAQVSIKNNAGFVYINIEQKGSSLVISKEIKLNNKVIETIDYNNLRALINVWYNKKYKELVLVKNI